VERHWERLVDAGIQSLSMSIDGLEGTHDRLRGQAGAFAKTWSALERVVRHGRLDPCVYFTVTRENVGELVAVWRRVRALGARFDFWPVNDAPELYLREDAERAAWRDAVATIGAEDPQVAARAHYYGEALGYHAGERSPVRCLGLVDQYGVTYDGRLLPCCVWGGDGLAVGNVFERPLRELWRSPEVQARREALYGRGCEVGCYNHSLYEFTASTGESHRVGRR
jgi:MoaA/NifB/PqqE/SkfB family radical SAM enzyme